MGKLLQEHKQISSVTLDSLTNITLHEIMAKYTARLTLLFTVSNMIEDELNCSFSQFFDLSCYALNQIVDS